MTLSGLDSKPAARQLSLAAALLAACVVFGGGAGGLADSGLQLAALAALAWLAVSIARGTAAPIGNPRLAWLLLLFTALPLLHLLPMPEAWWRLLPPRPAIASQLSLVGLQPRPHAGLVPIAAERALWSLLPAIALYLCTLTLTVRWQRYLLAALLLSVMAGVLLGLMQLGAGPDSALRFYAHTNRSEAVGFFANRNHHAAFLLMALPLSTLAIAHALARRATGPAHGTALLIAAIAMTALLMVGLALTRSRAGVLLGGVGFVLTLAIAAASQARPGLKRALGLVLAVGLLLSVQFGLSGLAVRFKTDPLVDERWQFAKVTLAAARGHAPLGSGIGTFRQAYQAQDIDNPGMAIVNHAHDDYLELWLEGGWPFAGLALLFAGLLAWAAARTWRRSVDDDDMLPARAASVSLLLACIHSAVDYPLRTSANEAVFAVLLAVLFSAAWPGRAAAARPGQQLGRPVPYPQRT